MGGRYYWFRFPEDFFDDLSILQVENSPSGNDALLLFLKLCCKSLKHDGRLIQQIDGDNFAFTENLLQQITRFPKRKWKKCFTLLQENKLVLFNRKGYYYIPMIMNLVGSESTKATKVRGKRHQEKPDPDITVSPFGVSIGPVPGNIKGTQMEQIKNNIVNEMRTELELIRNENEQSCSTEKRRDREEKRREELELELEKEHNSSCDSSFDIDNDELVTKDRPWPGQTPEQEKVFVAWEQEMHPLTPMIAGFLLDLIEEVGPPTVIESIKEAAKHGVRKFSYVRAIADRIARGDTRPVEPVDPPWPMLDKDFKPVGGDA